MPGVIRTRVGYTGGSKANPTYRSLGDHAETLQIDYDPTRLTFADILAVFWQGHTPTRPMWSRQYMAALFYHSEAQKIEALASQARLARQLNATITTQILPAHTFYLAEDYHQKYMLRQNPNFSQQFTAMYPHLTDFINSTAAARVNGYVSGYGSLAQFQAEMDKLGLSAQACQQLQEMVQRFERYNRNNAN